MLCLLPIGLVLAAVPLQEDETADRLAAAGVAEFTAAYQAWDGERFRAAADLFQQACARAPGSHASYYWLGVAQFHRMLQLRNAPGPRTNDAAADAAMEAAVAALDTAVKLDPRHAESHALLGTLYGMRIGGNLVRAVRFGPAVQKNRNQALELGKDNPRVQYLLGMGLFHTAKGAEGQRQALATLLLAEKLFVAEAQRPAGGPLEPRWGQSSCRTFIGRTYELLGQRREAVDYYGKALAEHPADRIAREGLARVAEKN
jgi:tetratricopeptide (TPR) repeat protein